jgi:hypothetical protein
MDYLGPWVCGDGIDYSRVPLEKRETFVCGFGCGLKWGETAPANTAVGTVADTPASAPVTAAETTAEVLATLAADVKAPENVLAPASPVEPVSTTTDQDAAAA